MKRYLVVLFTTMTFPTKHKTFAEDESHRRWPCNLNSNMGKRTSVI